eukprot:1182447-Prorocentrum_minimum.AAC.3
MDGDYGTRPQNPTDLSVLHILSARASQIVHRVLATSCALACALWLPQAPHHAGERCRALTSRPWSASLSAGVVKRQMPGYHLPSGGSKCYTLAFPRPGWGVHPFAVTGSGGPVKDDVLHPIFQEDEFTLIVSGAVLGAIAGGVQQYLTVKDMDKEAAIQKEEEEEEEAKKNKKGAEADKGGDEDPPLATNLGAGI